MQDETENQFIQIHILYIFLICLINFDNKQFKIYNDTFKC